MTRPRTASVVCATVASICLVVGAASIASAMPLGEAHVFASPSPVPSPPSPADPAYGTYVWPVVGPVINGYRPPSSPYGPGHRGIDIAVPIGTPVSAAAGGVVAFAGSIAGSLYVSIDHPDGVRTTYSYLSSIAVHRGDVVAQGDVIGATGHGHPAIQVDHLHFGARFDGAYIDPMLLLPAPDLTALIRLAPLVESGSPRIPGR